MIRMTDPTKSDDLPEPLVPKEVDLRDFSKMPVKVNFLLNSDTWLLTSGDEAEAAITLWCRAWHQVPAGSLPRDERLLARVSSNEPNWRCIRDGAMRGFVPCSDGRYYHKAMVEIVMES